MVKRYLEVEIEYTGTKVFRIPIDDTLTIERQMAYVGENYQNLDRHNNAYGDTVECKFLYMAYREDER